MSPSCVKKQTSHTSMSLQKRSGSFFLYALVHLNAMSRLGMCTDQAHIQYYEQHDESHVTDSVGDSYNCISSEKSEALYSFGAYENWCVWTKIFQEKLS